MGYSNSNKNKYLQLINTYRTALMGWASIMVLIYHVRLSVFSSGDAMFRIENYIRYTGFIGVDIFLLLSGMGLYYAIQKYDIKTFYRRRFARILLPLFIMAVVMAVVDKWSLKQFVCNITGINFYLNGPFSFLWYAIAIIQIYLLFPIYYKVFDKVKNKKKFTILAILVWLVSVIIFTDTSKPDIFIFLNRIPVFLIGVLFGWKEKHEKVEFTKYHYGICFVILLLGWFMEYIVIAFKTLDMIHLVGTGIPALLVAIPLTILLPQIFNMLSTNSFGKWFIKLLNIIGGVSFELYVVQEWLFGKALIIFEDIQDFGLITNILSIILIFISCYALVKLCKLINKLGVKIEKYSNKLK